MLGTEDTIRFGNLIRVLRRNLSPEDQIVVLEDIRKKELGWNDSDKVLAARIKTLRKKRKTGYGGRP